MNDKEVLEACITKAIEGGWKGVSQATYYWPDGKDLLTQWRLDLANYCYTLGAGDDYEDVRLEVILFDIDFAKALFGTDIITVKYLPLPDYPKIQNEGNDLMARWQYHLQQLAIAENRISYLKENA